MAKVSIVDYGVGNIGSICNMYRKLQINASKACSASDVRAAERLILPGIGAFDACIQALDASGLRDAVLEFAGSGRPMLGICVGMQMLTHGSDEGDLRGLGLIDADTTRFPAGGDLRVPHMGWNVIDWSIPDHPMARELTYEARFYFVHSYRVICTSPSNSLGSCDYGGPFDAAIARGNIIGAQFHPEKSHRFGLRFLQNFVTL